jgi:adenine-specific DNA-methyltransferase
MPTLQWLNKEDALKTAQSVPYRILEHDAALSYGDPDNENLLIQGDNLDALKALMPFYAGRVKCIYIDPPYNTQNAFEHYDDNLEHSTWLSLMYPRLELLRDFLDEDGSIWVSIDDDEAHYLKVIMDEIFGRKNFIGSAIWQKIHSIKNDAKYLSNNHDYILIFAKNIDKIKFNLLERTEKMNNRYINPDKDSRGPWQSGDLVANEIRTDGNYDLVSPSGKVFRVPEGKHWVYSKENMYQLIRDNRIWFGKNGSAFPRKKRFLSEVQQGRTPDTWWICEDVGHNQEAKREVKRLFPDDVFGTPKPERLIKRIITISSNPNDIVLDSFLGSGTTAAVAHKMGRRYIGIEMGEHAVTHCAPRLQKVIQGEQGGISQAVNWQGGGGFRFYRLGSPIFDETGHINPAVRFDMLAAHIWFGETRTPLGNNRKSALLGIHNDTAYYLLFNGILGDKRPDGGNVLTGRILQELPSFSGKKVIYGEATRLSPERLRSENIVFKHIPYDLKAR